MEAPLILRWMLLLKASMKVPSAFVVGKWYEMRFSFCVCLKSENRDGSLKHRTYTLLTCCSIILRLLRLAWLFSKKGTRIQV